MIQTIYYTKCEKKNKENLNTKLMGNTETVRDRIKRMSRSQATSRNEEDKDRTQIPTPLWRLLQWPLYQQVFEN